MKCRSIFERGIDSQDGLIHRGERFEDGLIHRGKDSQSEKFTDELIRREDVFTKIL